MDVLDEECSVSKCQHIPFRQPEEGFADREMGDAFCRMHVGLEAAADVAGEGGKLHLSNCPPLALVRQRDDRPSAALQVPNVPLSIGCRSKKTVQARDRGIVDGKIDPLCREQLPFPWNARAGGKAAEANGFDVEVIPTAASFDDQAPVAGRLFVLRRTPLPIT